MRITRRSFLLGAAALAAAPPAVGAAPALPAAPEKPEGPPTAEQFRKAVYKLRQIALAMHNYESTCGRFPADVTSADGKPLLSWRIHLLPYIEELALYRQFRLDEPWDSEHNKKLLPRIPELYKPVRGRAKEGETFYQVFAGKDAFLPPPEKGKEPVGRRVREFRDGMANTFMVVEAGEPVPWTKPADLPFDPKKPLPKLGGMFGGDFHAVFNDGTVRRIGKDTDPEVLKALITPAGGESVDSSKLK